MDCSTIIFRSIISIVVLFIVTKIIGKKQVSELSLFDYIIGISIGNFAAEIIFDNKTKYILGLIAMATFGVSAYIVSLLSIKSIKFRRLTSGIPTVIIQDGKLLVDSMKRVKTDINDLLEQARISGYFDIDEIAFAIMEANGKISFLTKDKFNQATKEELKLPINKTTIPANIIIDSKLMIENIKNIDKDINWINKKLKAKGYNSYQNILLATYKNNDITIYDKNKNLKSKDILE